MMHKTSRVLGFHILATDGEIGHVDDFLLDEHLATKYLVVDTSNWFGGKSILVSPSAIQKIDSPEQRIYVGLTRDQIEHSPSVESANIELIETLPPVLLL